MKEIHVTPATETGPFQDEEYSFPASSQSSQLPYPAFSQSSQLPYPASSQSSQLPYPQYDMYPPNYYHYGQYPQWNHGVPPQTYNITNTAVPDYTVSNMYRYAEAVQEEPNHANDEENVSLVFAEPLSNFSSLLKTPSQTSLETPPRVSLSYAPQMASLSPVAEDIEHVEESIEPTAQQFNLKTSNSSQPLSRSQFDGILSSSTPGPIPRMRKRKNMEETPVILTSGWLSNLFITMTANEIPTLQLLNWKFRTVESVDRLCLTLSDGTHTTKQITVDDDLADVVREAPLYSTMRVMSGTISEGCIFNIEEIEIVQTDLVQPVLHCETLAVLEKNFFQEIFYEKGMLTKEGDKLTNHPHFQHTPIRMMTRARMAPETLWPPEGWQLEELNVTYVKRFLKLHRLLVGINVKPRNKDI